MINNLTADFLKLKKTAFFLIHLLVPLLGVFIFFSYQLMAQHDGNQLMINFCQVLSLVYPIVASWLTNIVINQEIEAGGGFFLLSTVSRSRALLSKLFYLFASGLFACFIAIVGYHLLNRLFVMNYHLSFLQVGHLVLLVFGCSIFQYFFHTCLCLKFNPNVNLGIATIEFLIGALMLTGLGELMWIAFPSAWGMRLIRFLGNNFSGDALLKFISFPIILLIIAVITLLMGAILFVLMNRWEGRTNEE